MASPTLSAIGQCKFLEYAAEAMNDSAFGSTSPARSIGAMWDYFSMPVRQLAISAKR